MAEESNSSRLEQAEGDDEDCTERGQGTNCKTGGAVGFIIGVGWSGVLVAAVVVVVVSALDADASVFGIDRCCGVVGGLTAECGSKLTLFSSANIGNALTRCQKPKSVRQRSSMRTNHQGGSDTNHRCL